MWAAPPCCRTDAVRALLAASPDDAQVLAQGMWLFEGLYATTPRKA